MNPPDYVSTTLKVFVELRPENGKLFCQATFETEDGPFVISGIFVHPYHGGRPRVALPRRRDGAIWVPTLHLPGPWFDALCSAVADALAGGES